MKIGLLSDFFMDIKNWVYNWDTTTFAIVITLISLLLCSCAITFIKGVISKADKKPKIKVFPLIFMALLVVMLVLILKVRV